MPARCYNLPALRINPRVTPWSTRPRSMPRCVSPQWQTSRGFYLPRAPCRAHARGGALVFPPTRGYAKTATPDSRTWTAIQPLNSAILIPASLQKTQPDQLVNYIDPIAREHVTRDTFCVFLVTPSFASWLANEKTFLAQAIRRLYSKTAATGVEQLTVQALCAVVDKLPAGRALGASETLEDVVARRSTERPAGESGYEGIAYVTLPASASVPSKSPRSPDKGAIDFMFSRRDIVNKPHRDVWRLPLANTVFQTGLPTTMSYTRWTIDAREKMVSLEERADVTHHGVGIAMADSSTTSPQMSSVLSIPLLPLTHPRPVEGCMGNIIRRVIGPDGESVTASSELEKVVPRFFKARGEPAQPTTAWALVIPKRLVTYLETRTRRVLAKRISKKEKGTNVEDDLWDRLWQAQPTAWNTLVSTALAEGARLHRVLSGGGGWGKKAGLLSLDPVPVSEEVPIRMEDATSGFDGPGDFSGALTPVVRDGDAIQFFISPTSLPQVESKMALDELKAIPKQRTLGWELGIIPSTMDSMPGGSWQHVVSDSEYVAVFKNSFGALSEGGITLTRSRGQNPQASPETFLTTTIDVPYSRFWSVELGDKESSAANLKFSWQRESQELLRRLSKQDPPQSKERSQKPFKQDESQSTLLVRRVATRNVTPSELASERLYSIVQAISELTEEHKSSMRSIRQRKSQFNQDIKSLRKNLKSVSRNLRKSRFAFETLRAKVDEIELRARAGFTIRRYAVKESEIPIRQFISKASHIDINGVTAKVRRVSGLHAHVLSRIKQDNKRVGRKQRLVQLRIRRHMVRDASATDSVAAESRRLERTLARLSALHAHVLSSIKQRIERAGRMRRLRHPRIRRHVVRSTPTRERTYRRRIISTRQRKLRKTSPRRIRYINKLSIQRHATYPEQRSRLQQRFARIRRVGQSRPRGSIEPRQQKRKQLLQTVSSWLEGASTNATSTPAERAGRVTRRPFGSRVVESDDEAGEDGNALENNGGQLGGLELLMNSVKEQEVKGRRGR